MSITARDVALAAAALLAFPLAVNITAINASGEEPDSQPPLLQPRTAEEARR